MKINLKLFNLLFATLLLNAWIHSISQTKNGYSFSGSLIDSVSTQPLEFASVAVYKSIDTSLVSGAITNANGEFSIKNLPSGKFVVRFSCIGFKTKTTQAEITNSSLTLTDPVLMINSLIYYNSVLITGQRNEKEVNIEKTKINVAQNFSSASGNITDILKSQSSISIDADNSIYLRGNSNILILLDGRPTTITTLNSIPASSVESIDIVTNPDAKYDAEGTGGIINIVMKNQSKEGLNGIITLNNGFYNRLNGGLSLNYSQSTWNVFFNYSGKYEKSDIHSNLTRELHTQSVYVEQELNSTQRTPTQTAALQLSAKPDNNVISLGLKMTLPDVFNSQNILGRNVYDTLPEILFNRRNEVTFSRKIFESTLSYKKIFEKNKNEISFDAFFSRSKGSRPAEYFIENKMLQKSAGGGAPTNITMQIDYIKSVLSTGKIESGVKVFSRWNSFKYNFEDLDTVSNEWKTNLTFSNDLDHKEYIYSTYLMYSDSLYKQLFYKTGIRLEYNTSELIQRSINYQLNKEYFFPFPYLMIKYTIDKFQEAGLSLNRRITRPTYPQLNPVISVIDQMTYETGNKYLVPEVSDKAEFYYSIIKEKYQLSSKLFFSTTKDFITQVSLFSYPDKLILTNVNAERQNKIGGDFNASFKINKMFSMSPSLSVFYTKTSGKYNEIDLSTSSFAWAGNIKTIIKPEQETELQFILTYNSPVTLPQFKLGEIYYADISAKRNFFDKKLVLSLTLSDIFNTRKWNVNSENKVFNLNNSSKNDTRIFWIGISYNINAFTSSQPSKNEGVEGDNGIIKLGQ
ncbi:MAG: outer membrane beta-barrel protein [Ignavibacteria bacterium]|nr:outer membrane beta-barrel protein [Ignavibacteria bacterium]